MTKRYPGGYITKTPPTVSTTSAPGIWTMEQQAAYQKAGTWPFGGPFNYIEDVFSTYLYTGTAASQPINNGIDLAGKGGLVWTKQRDTGSYQDHVLLDTARGLYPTLCTNNANAQFSDFNRFTSWNSNGYTLSGTYWGYVNEASKIYASWTFRKQPKFFDVVTYTGDGAATRTISHNLGSTPGFVIIKNMDSTGNWMCWHNSFAATDYIALNTTGAKNYAGTYTDIYKGVSSTTVTIGSNGVVNNSGYNYVMYVFAHNAGGFGSSNADNVISCGSITADSGGSATINLGYEPQWFLLKSTDYADNWYIADNMRGWSMTGWQWLIPNSSGAEAAYTGFNPTATGAQFTGVLQTNASYIYIAIRRGPMKTPTTGASVFTPVAYSGTGATRTITGVGFPLDANIVMRREAHTYNLFSTRLQGLSADGSSVATPSLASNTTDAEFTTFVNSINATSSSAMDGYTLYNAYTQMNASGGTYVSYNFRRAPGFFDVVCYTGTGGNPQTVTHNLGVAPNMVIVKRRDAGATPNWTVGLSFTSTPYQDGLYLNATNALIAGDNEINGASATTISVRNTLSASGGTFVAYLFASCPGVSKVGSYTGTGGTQTISCGFAARFVLIKRTDSTGSWWVWDTARGMVAGTDPRLEMNTTNAETNANWVYTDASGFQIVTTDATVNASGGSYIYLAIS